MISILGNVKMPNDGTGVQATGSTAPMTTSTENMSKENFDSYFSKLQNICTDNMNDDMKTSVCGTSGASDKTSTLPGSNFSAAANAVAAVTANNSAIQSGSAGLLPTNM